MSRVLILLAVCGLAMALDNSTTTAETFCIEYSECMEKAQAKSSECSSSETTVEVHGKKTTCEEAKKVQTELQKLYDEKTTVLGACVKEKASLAEQLTGKKAAKCAAALKKLSRRASSEPQKRDKRKERRDKKEKTGSKSCAKEARKLRTHCAKIAKCCSAVKECNNSAPKDALTAKKKELKDTVKQCREREGANGKKSKKHSRKGKTGESATTDSTTKRTSSEKTTSSDEGRGKLGKKLEDAQAKKRLQPIGGKKLEAELPHADDDAEH